MSAQTGRGTKCKTCTHTLEWHAKRLAGGGHETPNGWCSCPEFLVTRRRADRARP